MADRTSSSFGHLALHYREAEDGPRAARLLEALGFSPSYSTEGAGGRFWHFVIDPQAEGGTDRILYLIRMPAPLRAVYDAIDVGLTGSAEVAALREAQAKDPELGFHAAVLMHSLEELEALVQRVAAIAAEDPELAGRVRLTLNRARPGTPAVDARMDASPVFAQATRHTYGPNGVQVFVETDLIAGGPMGDNWVFEFDYVFPGYEENILNRPTPKAPLVSA
ncbi:hypothetical protein [Sphingomonas bacterium]|uniref:hypothetical protein n=1 Tax=Sphingomonas bacterium TaxID=1895847 RepID=UPI001575AD1F|nr:hypothetical protein [Sphingomonas bacterium]